MYSFNNLPIFIITNNVLNFLILIKYYPIINKYNKKHF